MRKPKLEDFQLNETLIEKYERQIKRLSAEEKRISEVNTEIKDKQSKADVIGFAIGIISWIVMLIIFCVVVIPKANSEEGLSAGMSALAFFVFVGMFPAAWGLGHLYRINCEAAQLRLREVDRFSFVDKNLEEKIQKYKNTVAEYEEYLNATSEKYWRSMNPFEFEEEVARLFDRLGYQAETTRKTADGGVDIILRKNGLTYAVQCKHHNHPVAPAAVRELRGVLGEEYDKGIFVALSGFTQGVYEENRTARGKRNIELITLKDLIRLNKQYYESCNEALEEEKERKNIFSNDKDLQQKRTGRQTQNTYSVRSAYENAEWKPVETSTWMRSIGYCKERGLMFIRGIKQELYAFEKIPEHLFNQLKESKVKDVFIKEYIVNRFKVYRVTFSD